MKKLLTNPTGRLVIIGLLSSLSALSALANDCEKEALDMAKAAYQMSYGLDSSVIGPVRVAKLPDGDSTVYDYSFELGPKTRVEDPILASYEVKMGVFNGKCEFRQMTLVNAD